MNILLIGGGGREHALAWKVAQSPLCQTLYIAPGNGGTEDCGTNVALDAADHEAVVAFCRKHAIDFVVIGPDAPAVAGLGDDLRAAGITCFGPSRAAAQLEGSKTFTKRLCDEVGIPTARYATFDTAEDACAYLRGQPVPIVIKADGLALGKGVTVAATHEEAEAAVKECFAGRFGDSGAQVVVEECLVGEEASLFVLCDGRNTLLLDSAQDHKRAFDGDEGPNTGGMGAYSPAPVMTPEMTARTMAEIITPTVAGLARRGTPFQGVLYAGLMLTADGPKLIEYNVRFGDPETQVLMVRLKSDLVPLLLAVAKGDLSGAFAEWDTDLALTVVLATQGYPGSYEKGSTIRGAETLDSETVRVFHAGTRREGETLKAVGGRVLNVTATGHTAAEARQRAYEAVDRIEWPEGFCRRDIGSKAINR